MGLAEWLVRPFVIGIEWDWLAGTYDLLSEALNWAWLNGLYLMPVGVMHIDDCMVPQ